MKKTILVTAVAAAAYASAPAAQQPPDPAAKTPPAHNVYVLVGCVQAGDSPATFKLTDASPIGQAPPSGAAEASAVATGQKASYLLRPVSGVNAQGLKEEDLKARLGQRVEVVVRPIESAKPAPTAGLASDQGAQPQRPAPEPFSVTEIKRVMGKCS